MGRPERVTPRALLDLFSLMSAKDQCDFLRLLGSEVTAEAPFIMASSLDRPELMRFAEMVTCSPAVAPYFLIMRREAVRFARANPDLTEEDMATQFGDHMKQFMETYDQKIGEVQAAKLKQERDRKSDPEIVKRNVAICDLRKQDRKKWSYRRLAREFKITPQAIGLVLKDESKWRRLAASAK